jgi:hypothetical protein
MKGFITFTLSLSKGDCGDSTGLVQGFPKNVTIPRAASPGALGSPEISR